MVEFLPFERDFNPRQDMLRALHSPCSSCLRGALMGATLLAASVSVTPAAPLPNIRLSPDLSFDWGRTIAEYAADTRAREIATLMGAWLRYFRAQADSMRQP